MSDSKTPNPDDALTALAETTDGKTALAGPRYVDHERTPLDDETDRLHRAGQLRLLDTIDGTVMLGYLKPEVDHLGQHEAVILGEIESRTPEGMTRHMAPEHVGLPFRDVFFLTGSPPKDGWDYLAWAYSVPAVVEGIEIPHALRVTIASAASAANTLVDLAGLLRQFTDRVDRACEAMANGNTPEGEEPDELLVKLGDALRRPLMQRIDKAARLMHTDAGFLADPTDQPLQLDGASPAPEIIEVDGVSTEVEVPTELREALDSADEIGDMLVRLARRFPDGRSRSTTG